MSALTHLLESNRGWATKLTAAEPNFFAELAHQQAPEYLWIGCSDSRVPANVIVDFLPEELLVDRNVANLVIHSDMNCLSVLQFAVDVLKVRHVIVCGHYGCGEVRAAVDGLLHGLIDSWLHPIRDICRQHEEVLGSGSGDSERLDRHREPNVRQQVINVGNTKIVQDARARR